ncbi:MAG: anti-sigma factor antagonist [Hespellia sp.]|nr:anti-sigma factor antagonist [Hespellia sp.]
MNYKIQENYLTVYLPKEVDHYNAEEMRKEADLLITHNHIRYLIFDFGETEFCDSSGIGVIMGRYRLLNLLGGEVWAVHVGARMRKILTLSGVLNIMKIYEEERA